AVKYMKDAIQKTYGRKGEKVVSMNMAAVDAGIANVHKVDVPEAWAEAPDDEPAAKLVGRDQIHTDYLNDVLVPTNKLTGDNVPVSTFLNTANGMIPAGTAAYEKRGIATDIPVWKKENCMQCNWCSYVCPHGVIRPFVLDGDEVEPVNSDYTAMKGAKG